MEPAPQELIDLVKRQRIKLDMSQMDLASKIEVSQTAISHFESGKFNAVPEKKRDVLLSVLGIDGKTLEARLASKPLACCPNPLCHKAHHVVVDERLAAIPLFFDTSNVAGSRCPYCSSSLITKCTSCGRALRKGLFCIGCGNPYAEHANETQNVEDPVDAQRRLNARAKDFADHEPRIEIL